MGKSLIIKGTDFLKSHTDNNFFVYNITEAEFTTNIKNWIDAPVLIGSLDQEPMRYKKLLGFKTNVLTPGNLRWYTAKTTDLSSLTISSCTYIFTTESFSKGIQTIKFPKPVILEANEYLFCSLDDTHKELYSTKIIDRIGKFVRIHDSAPSQLDISSASLLQDFVYI